MIARVHLSLTRVQRPLQPHAQLMCRHVPPHYNCALLGSLPALIRADGHQLVSADDIESGIAGSPPLF